MFAFICTCTDTCTRHNCSCACLYAPVQIREMTPDKDTKNTPETLFSPRHNLGLNALRQTRKRRQYWHVLMSEYEICHLIERQIKRPLFPHNPLFWSALFKIYFVHSRRQDRLASNIDISQSIERCHLTAALSFSNTPLFLKRFVLLLNPQKKGAKTDSEEHERCRLILGMVRPRDKAKIQMPGVYMQIHIYICFGAFFPVWATFLLGSCDMTMRYKCLVCTYTHV